jgi:hypothetical protein
VGAIRSSNSWSRFQPSCAPSSAQSGFVVEVAEMLALKGKQGTGSGARRAPRMW